MSTSASTRQTRVMVVDDHPVFRDGLGVLLASLPGVVVVAEASTGVEAVAGAEEHRPDVILMDINMPDMNGVEATRRILTRNPDVAILMLTMFDDDASVSAAVRAGARGYLLKGSDQVQIRRALEAVSGGEAIFGPAIAKRLMGHFDPAARADALPELTPREHEVLALIAQGLTNDQIAARLVISPKTTRNHVSNIFSKLEVTDRVQAVLRARDAGLGSSPAPL